MATEYKWESATLGQNHHIAKIASEAAKASKLLNTYIKFNKTQLKIAQKFLLDSLNPKIKLLNAIADEIDNFVSDFKNTGFYILEVTPTGKETIPTDADGDPIEIFIDASQVAYNYSIAASAGMTHEFLAWTANELGIESYETTGAELADYAVKQGKSQPAPILKKGANDNSVATKDPLFGMYKFTPSQVIAQTIAAIDDKLDERAPIFSDSAQVGAVMIIIGYADMSIKLPDLYGVLKLVIDFFGGENGLFTKGLQKVANQLNAAIGGIEDETQNSVKIIVDQVSGIYGTEDDAMKFHHMETRQNFKDQFELYDFVLGPNMGFGSRAMGYVSEVPITITPNTNEPIYQKQELVITGATEEDAIAFRKLCSGASLQLAHYEKNEERWIDNNSGIPMIGKYTHGYKFLEELEEGELAQTKVHRKKKDEDDPPDLPPAVFLSSKGKEKLDETLWSGTSFKQKFKKGLVGKIAQPPKGEDAPPPNFKAAKLEDIMGDFQDFFSGLETLSDGLREIAGDSGTELKKFIKYLDGKIKELDKFNKTLQKILKIFSDGLPSSGVYSLVIPGEVGGNKFIKETLQNAQNRPPDSLDFAVGFLMMGGGPSMKVLSSLLASAK